MKRYLIITVTMLISCVMHAQERKHSEVVWMDKNGISVPLPPMEHPRLFIRSGEVPALKEKMLHSEGKKILRKLRNASVPRVKRNTES